MLLTENRGNVCKKNFNKPICGMCICLIKMRVDEPKLGKMRFDSAPSKYSFGVCFAKGLAMLVTTFSDQPPLRKNTQ